MTDTARREPGPAALPRGVMALGRLESSSCVVFLARPAACLPVLVANDDGGTGPHVAFLGRPRTLVFAGRRAR